MDIGPRYSLDQVKEYWARQALAHGTSSTATWADGHAVQMEIEEILKYLKDGDRVLDVGSGNGYPAIQFAKRRRVALKGIDLVPEMVAASNALLSKERDSLLGSVAFDCGDIMSLKEPEGAFDTLVVTRVLINLVNLDNQARALKECSRVLRRGGRLLLCEASLQGWSNLNRLRTEWGLEEIPMPPFNLFINEEDFLPLVEGEFTIEGISNFSSSYFLGTRFLKPLMARMAGSPVDPASPNSEWNRLMSQLPPIGDYGKMKLFSLIRK